MKITLTKQAAVITRQKEKVDGIDDLPDGDYNLCSMKQTGISFSISHKFRTKLYFAKTIEIVLIIFTYADNTLR